MSNTPTLDEMKAKMNMKPKQHSAAYHSITEGPFPDHKEGTHSVDVSETEAKVILQEFVRVARYKLPDYKVAELLRKQVEMLTR